MDTNAIILATGLMTAYLLFIMLTMDRVPSISDSFYKLRVGFFFQTVIILYGILMAIGFTGYPLLSFAGFLICFVAAAPNFKNGGYEKFFHFFGAYGAILTAYIGFWWYFNYWWAVVVVLIAFGIVNWYIPRRKVYWIEIIAIYTISLLSLCAATRI